MPLVVMSLRKNFDSFTAQHKLRDAQEEFAQAVYRFREAEEANGPKLATPLMSQGSAKGVESAKARCDRWLNASGSWALCRIEMPPEVLA